MEPVQLLTGLLTETLGLPSEEISAKLYKTSDDGTLTDEISESAQEEFKNLFVQKLQGIQGEISQADRDKLHQQAKFEALNKAEDTIRKKYNLGDHKGKLDALIDEVVTRASKANNSDDAVLIHPLYVGLKTQAEEQLNAIKEEYEAKIQATEQKVERQMRFNQILPNIDAALDAAGVDLSTVKANTKKAFLAQFDGLDFEVSQTGTFIKKPDGSLLKDDALNPIKLEAYVAKDAPNWFDIEKQPARQAPGNDPQPPAPNKSTKWKGENLPRSDEEFHTRFYQIPFEERAEFTEAYQKSKMG